MPEGPANFEAAQTQIGKQRFLGEWGEGGGVHQRLS